VRLYQDGDKSALNELVAKNTGIIHKLVNRFYINSTNSIDEDDLLQEGFLGLMLAADKYKFNLEHPCRFITYAVYWIYQKMQRYMSQKNTNQETSLNITVNEDDLELLDAIKDDDHSFENIEDKIYYEQLRRELETVMGERLTLKEREVLKFHYGWNSECMTFEDIAEIFEISKQDAKYTGDRAIRNIRYSPWGRLKFREHYAEKFSNEGYSIPEKIKALDFKQKYFKDENIGNWNV